jgi:hypothetical protein
MNRLSSKNVMISIKATAFFEVGVKALQVANSVT